MAPMSCARRHGRPLGPCPVALGEFCPDRGCATIAEFDQVARDACLGRVGSVCSSTGEVNSCNVLIEKNGPVYSSHKTGLFFVPK